jgi:hypothetical protein
MTPAVQAAQGRKAVVRIDGEQAVPARSSHTTEQEFAPPMTGFKIQRP